MIKAARELTLTIICTSCEHQYGVWRPRCPACGTDTPVKAQPINKPRLIRPRTSGTQCAFCRLSGAKSRCAVCNELVHGTCLSLHVPECEQYQREVAVEAARLAKGVRT